MYFNKYIIKERYREYKILHINHNVRFPNYISYIYLTKSKFVIKKEKQHSVIAKKREGWHSAMPEYLNVDIQNSLGKLRVGIQ